MSAQRVRRPNASRGWLQWLVPPKPADAPERAMLTCTACFRPVEPAEHCCPDCETVFYQPPDTAPRIPVSDTPSQPDAKTAEFSERMERVDGWLRAACLTGVGLSAGALVAALATDNGHMWWTPVSIALACLGRYAFIGNADL